MKFSLAFEPQSEERMNHITDEAFVAPLKTGKECSRQFVLIPNRPVKLVVDNLVEKIRVDVSPTFPISVSLTFLLVFNFRLKDSGLSVFESKQAKNDFIEICISNTAL